MLSATFAFAFAGRTGGGDVRRAHLTLFRPPALACYRRHGPRRYTALPRSP